MIEQLTQHQFRILKLLANGEVKIYCNVAGTKSDEHTQDFNGLFRLVELKLLEDISEECSNVVTKYKAKVGGDIAIMKLAPLGQTIFEKHRWTKWKN